MSEETIVQPDENGTTAATEAETTVEPTEQVANPDAESKPAEQGEQPGDEADEAKAEDGSKAPDKDQGKEDAKKQKKNRAQERITQLVDEKKSAERRAAIAEQRLAELEEKAPQKPNPSDEKYESDPDQYQADLNAYTLRSMRHEDVVETVKADKQQAAEARIQTFHARAEAFRDEVTDFDEVAFQRAPINSPDLVELIMESDMGPQIAYWMGKNPADARQIESMSRTQKAIAIGRLEGRLEVQKETPRRVTQAPEPIVPAAGRKAPTKLKYDEGMSMPDYEKWRKQEGIG